MPYVGEKNLERKIEENLKLSKEIYELTKKNRRWIVFQKIWFAIQLIIIILIVVSAWVYVPPIFEKITDIYYKFGKLKVIEEMKEGFPVEVTK